MTILFKIADALSYILHPAIIMLLTLALISNSLHHNPAQVMLDIIILGIGLFPGLLYIYLKTKRGDFGHYHLLLKQERRIALPLLVAGMIVSLTLYTFIRTSSTLFNDILIAIAGGIGVTIISRYWKISLHASVSMGAAALLMPISLLLSTVMIMLSIIAGVSRLIVKQHTVTQVIIGWIYGYGVTSVLLHLMMPG